MRRIAFVLIFSGFALYMSGQKKFVPILETFKRAYGNGTRPPGIVSAKMFNGNVYFAGWIDSAAPWVRNGNNYVLGPMMRNIENIIQYTNGTWSNGPDFPLSSSMTTVIAHEYINGRQYGSTEGESFPHDRVLDTVTNKFVDIQGIHFDYGYFTQMYARENDEVLFFGKNGSMGSVNGQQITSPVLWNQRTNAVRQTYSYFDGEKVMAMPWCISTFKWGDSIYGVERFGAKEIVSLGPNSDTWVHSRFGAIPGWDVDYAAMIDDVLYVITKYDPQIPGISYYFRLSAFKNNHWETLLDKIHLSWYGSTILGTVLGMVKYDNKIAIAATVDTVGGKPTSGIFFYDPANGSVSEIAPMPASLTRGALDCSGLFAPGDGNLYLAGWRGLAGVTGMESSTIFVLRNAAANAPVITGPTGTVGTTSVTITGTCESDTSIRISVYEGANIIGTAKPDNTGRWSLPCTLAEGTHTVYAVADRPIAERSAQSTNATFTIHINRAPAVSIGDTLIVSHASNASISGTASDPDGDVLAYKWTQISGPTNATISNDGLLTTTVSNLSEGAYRFKLTATDPLGLAASQTLTVQVSFITSVPPVIQNGTVVLYPNPTASALHLKGVAKVLTVHNMAGQQLGVRQDKVGNETVLQVYHYPTGTYFVTFEYTGRKTATAAFRVVR